MIRRLLWLLFFVVIGWFLRSLFRHSRERPVGDARRGRSGEGKMVRDRVCNTFLPRDRALSLTKDGQVHFFCSDSCRSAFLGGRKAAP